MYGVILCVTCMSHDSGVTPDAAVAKEELREIRGVMRVGGLAVKTMIKEENTVELVVTCASQS